MANSPTPAPPPYASATIPGIVSTGAQVFGGPKDLNSRLAILSDTGYLGIAPSTINNGNPFIYLDSAFALNPINVRRLNVGVQSVSGIISNSFSTGAVIWSGTLDATGPSPYNLYIGAHAHDGSTGADPTKLMTFVSSSPWNVGIGTSSPAERLSVVGKIHSTTGGFKFPDNTIQTTAAVTGIGGSGTANQVAFFTASNTISSESNLTWDATSNRLGINTGTPLLSFHVNGMSAFGDSVTALNSIRAFNLASTDAVLRILRVSPSIDTAAPVVEYIHRTSADGADTQFWDTGVISTGYFIRDRTTIDTIRLMVETTGNISASKTFVTTQTSGNLAFSQLQGARFTTNGGTNTRYISDDGTNVTVTGPMSTSSSLAITGAFTGATTGAFSSRITSSQTSGNVAYSQLQGARLVTNGGTDTRYISDDGTNITITGPVSAANTITSTVASGSNALAMATGARFITNSTTNTHYFTDSGTTGTFVDYGAMAISNSISTQYGQLKLINNNNVSFVIGTAGSGIVSPAGVASQFLFQFGTSSTDLVWLNSSDVEFFRVTSAGNFFSKVTSGNVAFTLTQGARLVTNGATATRYVSDDGTNITFTGSLSASSSLAITGAFTGATTGAFSGRVTSSVASGSFAYSQLTGARFTTNGGTDTRYISDDGTNITFTGPISVSSSITSAGRINTSFASDAVLSSSSSSITAGNQVYIHVDATSAAATVNLPASSGISGRNYYIKKVDSSTNTVTIDANASETIDGALTLVLIGQYTSVHLVTDGSNWHIH